VRKKLLCVKALCVKAFAWKETPKIRHSAEGELLGWKPGKPLCGKAFVCKSFCVQKLLKSVCVSTRLCVKKALVCKCVRV